MSLTLEELQQKLLPVLKQTPIKRMAVFGSFAEGTQDVDSDVDLVFELLPNSLNRWDYLGVLVQLEDVLQKSVDLINYNQLSSLDNIDIHGAFRNRVKSKMRWIYELQ